MRRTILLLTLILSVPTWAVNGDMGSGNGTQANPYLIEDLADFDTFADPNNAGTYLASGVHTQLMTDIDLAGRTYTAAVIAPDINNTEWNGFQGTKYEGIFAGNNHIIANLTIVTSGNDYIGLFGYVGADGQVKSLKIENIYINGRIYVGGLVGYGNGLLTNCHTISTVNGRIYVGGLAGASYGTITGCCAKGFVSGTDDMYSNVGGLVGYNGSGTITSCCATSSVNGAGYNVGGLVGSNYDGVITDCCAVGEVIGAGYSVGGLVGENYNSTLTRCYASGSVKGVDCIGGLVGYNDGELNNCYATGSVIGNSKIGGLIGYNDGSLNNCYASGSIYGASWFGGLIGEHYSGTITACLWDTETSETTDGVGSDDPDPAGVSRKTTSEMMTQSTFTDAGWDFVTPVWMLLRPGEDYPRLAWQEIYLGDIAGLYGVDMIDAAYLSRYWQVDCPTDPNDCGRADIDTSGHVGLGDLTELVNDWLKN